MDDLRLLTVADVAERLGVSIWTVSKWCRKGLFANAIQGPKTGKGAIWLIPESDLTDFERPQVGRPRSQAGEDDQEGEP